MCVLRLDPLHENDFWADIYFVPTKCFKLSLVPGSSCFCSGCDICCYFLDLFLLLSVKKYIQESILPNLNFFVFPIFAIKLGHYKALTIFFYAKFIRNKFCLLFEYCLIYYNDTQTFTSQLSRKINNKRLNNKKMKWKKSLF